MGEVASYSRSMLETWTHQALVDEVLRLQRAIALSIVQYQVAVESIAAVLGSVLISHE